VLVQISETVGLVLISGTLAPEQVFHVVWCYPLELMSIHEAAMLVQFLGIVALMQMSAAA
jgi:hypothetical protein